MVPAEEVETRATTREMDDPGLVRVQLQPERGQDLGHQRPGLLGAVTGGAQDDGIVGVADQHPQTMATPRHSWSRTLSAILAINGEIGDPCGVPDPDSVVTPSTRTPDPEPRREQLAHLPVRHPPAQQRHQRVVIDRPEAVRTSASSTHSRPRLASTRMTSRAIAAERFGRNPKLHRREVGLEDRFEHELRGRHHHPVPHGGNAQRPGLARLAGLGMCTRRNGAGRYVSARNAAASLLRNSATPDASTSSTLTPSTPGAPGWHARRATPAT